MEKWTVEQVVAWLTMYNLTHVTDAFITNGISGRMLIALDHQALAAIGVTQEADQWRILQATEDFRSIDQRYHSACASRTQSAQFPMLFLTRKRTGTGSGIGSFLAGTKPIAYEGVKRGVVVRRGVCACVLEICKKKGLLNCCTLFIYFVF